MFSRVSRSLSASSKTFSAFLAKATTFFEILIYGLSLTGSWVLIPRMSCEYVIETFFLSRVKESIGVEEAFFSPKDYNLRLIEVVIALKPSEKFELLMLVDGIKIHRIMNLYRFGSKGSKEFERSASRRVVLRLARLESGYQLYPPQIVYSIGLHRQEEFWFLIFINLGASAVS